MSAGHHDDKTSLIHILRNCIDHGIEEPEVRVALGKPRDGMIKVSHETDELGNERSHRHGILCQVGMSRKARRAQFEDEQGQDDRKDPITEGFKPVF